MSPRSLKKLINNYSLLLPADSIRKIPFLLALLFKESTGNFIETMKKILINFVQSNYPQTSELHRQYRVSKWDGGVFEEDQWVEIVWGKGLGLLDKEFYKMLTEYNSCINELKNSDRQSKKFYMDKLINFYKKYSINSVSDEKGFFEYWNSYIESGITLDD